MKKIAIGITAFIVLSFLPAVNAELITIVIEGTVTSLIDDGSGDGWLDGKINIDDPVTGTYTYDTLTADTNPLSQVGD